MIQPALYLIPVNISDAPLSSVLPADNLPVVKEIRHFIVENVRTARRFLKRWDRDFDISQMTFYELNGHTDPKDISSFLQPLREGYPMGVMSEAGCPAVADPGSQAVLIAQQEGMKVVPLVGPSSILMSLMASGFNGQGFSFSGYLPIEQSERIKAVKDLEGICARKHITQIFIETPYRNNRMVKTLADNLRPDTLICVACDITDPEKESVVTATASEWRKRSYDYDKRPAIFLIHRL